MSVEKSQRETKLQRIYPVLFFWLQRYGTMSN